MHLAHAPRYPEESYKGHPEEAEAEGDETKSMPDVTTQLHYSTMQFELHRPAAEKIRLERS